MSKTWEPVTRRSRLLTLGVKPGSQSGLEFGALNNPIIGREYGDIRFVDRAPTEELRAHPHEATVDREAIVSVDYVWPGSGSLAEVVGSGELFDYAIASHVIEHVPNLLGWLHGISEVLKPGGVLNLAIPDKRYTFDVARALSTIGELVEAYLLGYVRPSIRQMFDHCSGARAMGPGECWIKEIDTKQLPPYSGDIALPLAYHQAQEIAAAGRYFDSHCWVFTPLSFLELIEQAGRLGLLPFVLTGFHPTEAGDFEFFVNFERPDPHEAGLRDRQTDAIQVAMKATADALRAARLLGVLGA
jgi:SAM-dependent methyltransferase